MPLITSATARSEPDRMHQNGNDPAHAAYGHAAAMLASARAFEAATQPSGSVPATPATLACLETSLDALSLADSAPAQAQRSIAPLAEELTGD